MKRIRKAFFRIVGKSFSDMKIQTSNAIHSFANSPIENLSILSSSTAFLMSLIAFIVALISFACSGGFAAQLKEINAVGALNYNLSYGNVSILTRGVFGISIKTLLGIGFIFLLVCFWNSSRLFMKIGSIIVLVLSGTDLGLMLWLQEVLRNRIKPTGIWLAFAIKLLGDTSNNKVFEFLGIVVIVLFAPLLVMLGVSECKHLFWHICRTTIFSLFVMPLVLMLIENLVALVAIVLLALAVVAFIQFLIAMLADAGGESAGASLSIKREKKDEKVKHEVKQVKRLEYPAGTKLFFDEGGGAVAPLGAKCIFAETKYDTKKYVCTYKDYKEQNVIIFINKKQIRNL